MIFFAPLMQRLNEQSTFLESVDAFPLWALQTQDYLWQGYVTQVNGIGSGISAMPSMHVSIAVLMALCTYRLNKTLGYFACAFAVIIQIGSVHIWDGITRLMNMHPHSQHSHYGNL